jgi:hypothetical protein
MSYFLAGLAVAVMGAYVCRVDELSWWRTPWLMLLHAGGGITSAWVLYHCMAADAGAPHVLALAGAVVLLWLTWEHLPSHGGKRREVYRTDLMVSAPLIGRRDRPLDPLDSRDHRD